MGKLIILENETHKKLSILKINKDLVSFDQIINYLLRQEETRQDEKDISGATER